MKKIATKSQSHEVYNDTNFVDLLKSPKTLHSSKPRIVVQGRRGSQQLFEMTGFRLLSSFGGLAGMTEMASVRLFVKPSP